MSFSNHSTEQHDKGRSCFISGISQTLQHDYLNYSNLAFTPVLISLGIWCGLSNATVPIAILRGGFRIRKGYVVLCSLAFIVLLWGGVVIPVYLKHRLEEIFNRHVCANCSDWDNPVMVVSFFVCLLGKVGTLTVMSVDRYLAVAKALWYKVSVKRWHAFLACLYVWMVSVSIVTAKLTPCCASKGHRSCGGLLCHHMFFYNYHRSNLDPLRLSQT